MTLSGYPLVHVAACQKLVQMGRALLTHWYVPLLGMEVMVGVGPVDITNRASKL